jgi:hypothetical protein
MVRPGNKEEGVMYAILSCQLIPRKPADQNLPIFIHSENDPVLSRGILYP